MTNTIPTPDEITAMDRAALRALVEQWDVSHYASRRDVLSFTVDEIVFRATGTLGHLENAITAVMDAYTDYDPTIETTGYGMFTVKAWKGDDELRQSLRYERERQVKAAETAAEAEE